MKKYLYGLLSVFFLCSIKIGANPTISFFFQPLSDIEKMMRKLKKPGYIAKNGVNGALNHSPVFGVLVLYAGYIATSDYNGEVIFPRKHQKSLVTIIITPKLLPVTLFENTVDHWELVPGVPAAMYSYEQKYNSDTEQYYWESKEISTPVNFKIPLESIIIVAKPKNIVIPLGIMPTRETANLVLPPIYITKGINIIENNIYMLTLRHLFKPVDLKNKREPIQILTHVID